MAGPRDGTTTADAGRGRHLSPLAPGPSRRPWPPAAPPLHTPVRGLGRCPGRGALPGLQLVARMVSICLGLDGLAGRRRVGWVGHGGQAVGQGHGAGDDAFDCGGDAAGGHAHDAWGVPAGGGRRQVRPAGQDPRLRLKAACWGTPSHSLCGHHPDRRSHVHRALKVAPAHL